METSDCNVVALHGSGKDKRLGTRERLGTRGQRE